MRGVRAPHGSSSTSAPASRRSVRTSSSYMRSPDCSGHTIAHSHRPRASPAKTARSSGVPGDVPQRGGPAGREDLGVRGLVDAHERAGVGPVDAREPRAEPDAQLLGDQDQLADAAERARARAGDGGRAAAAAVVTRVRDAREQPADRQRPGHPHRHLRPAHDDLQGLDTGRDHRLERKDRAVHIALPGVGKETGRPDPASALRATGFAPHRAPRSSPAVAPSRTITRPECGPPVEAGAARAGSCVRAGRDGHGESSFILQSLASLSYCVHCATIWHDHPGPR